MIEREKLVLPAGAAHIAGEAEFLAFRDLSLTLHAAGETVEAGRLVILLQRLHEAQLTLLRAVTGLFTARGYVPARCACGTGYTDGLPCLECGGTGTTWAEIKVIQ